MRPRPSKRLTSVAAILTGGFLLLGWIAGIEIYRWALLRNSDSVAAAMVTAERLNPCSGKGCWRSAPYQIKYQFQIVDAGMVYAYTGQMISPEPWVRVSQRLWEQAVRDKRINVRYAPQNPRINQPADLERPGLLNALGLALLALMLAVVAGFYWRGYKV